MFKKVLVSSVLFASLTSFGAINNVIAADVDANSNSVDVATTDDTNVDLNAAPKIDIPGGYEEIDCSTDTVFAENSCHQCFVGGQKAEGSYIGLMDDTWINSTNYDQIMYKEQQKDPKMINLNTSKVTWKQTPSADGFWKMTKELNSIMDEDKQGFLLKKGQKVRWIEMKVGSAYHLAKNEVAAGENIGLVVFPIIAHNILDNGEITPENDEHHECVLFKSASPKTVVKKQPKKLPDTGPAQFLILLVLAMILAFGVLRFRKS